MKKRMFRTRSILSWTLLFCLFSCCSGILAERETEAEGPSVFQTFLQKDLKRRRDPDAPAEPSDLFYAARNADGDALANFAEAQRCAAELGIARVFAFDTEDAIAAENGSTERIMAGYELRTE